MKSKYLLSALEKDEIKVCLPGDCNDPFELTPARLEGKTASSTDGVGFICFSEEWASSTMWAHYADKHKGVCLEFSFEESGGTAHMEADDDEGREYCSDVALLKLDHKEQYTELPVSGVNRFVPILMKVKYHPYRAYPVESQVRCIVNGSGIEDARYSRFYAAKGQEWAYEKEWRLFVTLDKCLSYRDGCYFVKRLTKCLTKVMLGRKCTYPTRYIQDKINALMDQPVSCVRMESDGNLFALKEAGREESKVPRVWRANLEFTDFEWKKIQEYIVQRSDAASLKSGGGTQSIFNLLKVTCSLPDRNNR